mgnify:CR=1 FL=1
MNEQLQAQFVQILKSVSESAVAAKDFVLAELPDIAQQVINWYLFKSVFENIIALIWIIFAIYLLIKLFQVPVTKSKANKFQLFCYEFTRDGETKELMPTVLIPIVAIIICVILSIHYLNLDCFKIIIAPKLWLIEYTTHILRR